MHLAGAQIDAQLHRGGLVAGYSFQRWAMRCVGVCGAAAHQRRPRGSLLDGGTRRNGGELPEMRVLGQSDIDLAVKKFARAARSAKDAGFDGADIHGGPWLPAVVIHIPFGNTRSDD